MVPIQSLANVLAAFVRTNATQILTASAVAGVVGTALITFNEAPKAKEILDDMKEDLKDAPKEEHKDIIFVGVKKIAPKVIPIVVSVSLSIASIIGLNKIHAQRYAAMSAAYAIADRSLKEWKEHTEEIVGKKKMEDIKMAIADEQAKKIDPEKAEKPNYIQPGDSAMERLDVVRDPNTGSEFYSSASRVREAIAKVQSTLNGCDWVSVNDFYRELGVTPIKWGERLGWNTGQEVDIEMIFSSTRDDRPCIILSYEPDERRDSWGDKYKHSYDY